MGSEAAGRERPAPTAAHRRTSVAASASGSPANARLSSVLGGASMTVYPSVTHVLSRPTPWTTPLSESMPSLRLGQPDGAQPHVQQRPFAPHAYNPDPANAATSTGFACTPHRGDSDAAPHVSNQLGNETSDKSGRNYSDNNRKDDKPTNSKCDKSGIHLGEDSFSGDSAHSREGSNIAYIAHPNPRRMRFVCRLRRVEIPRHAVVSHDRSNHPHSSAIHSHTHVHSRRTRSSQTVPSAPGIKEDAKDTAAVDSTCWPQSSAVLTSTGHPPSPSPAHRASGHAAPHASHPQHAKASHKHHNPTKNSTNHDAHPSVTAHASTRHSDTTATDDNYYTNTRSRDGSDNRSKTNAYKAATPTRHDLHRNVYCSSHTRRPGRRQRANTLRTLTLGRHVDARVYLNTNVMRTHRKHGVHTLATMTTSPTSGTASLALSGNNNNNTGSLLMRSHLRTRSSMIRRRHGLDRSGVWSAALEGSCAGHSSSSTHPCHNSRVQEANRRFANSPFGRTDASNAATTIAASTTDTPTHTPAHSIPVTPRTNQTTPMTTSESKPVTPSLPRVLLVEELRAQMTGDCEAVGGEQHRVANRPSQENYLWHDTLAMTTTPATATHAGHSRKNDNNDDINNNNNRVTTHSSTNRTLMRSSQTLPMNRDGSHGASALLLPSVQSSQSIPGLLSSCASTVLATPPTTQRAYLAVSPASSLLTRDKDDDEDDVDDEVRPGSEQDDESIGATASHTPRASDASSRHGRSTHISYDPHAAARATAESSVLQQLARESSRHPRHHGRAVDGRSRTHPAAAYAFQQPELFTPDYHPAARPTREQLLLSSPTTTRSTTAATSAETGKAGHGATESAPNLTQGKEVGESQAENTEYGLSTTHMGRETMRHAESVRLDCRANASLGGEGESKAVTLTSPTFLQLSRASLEEDNRVMSAATATAAAVVPVNDRLTATDTTHATMRAHGQSTTSPRPADSNTSSQPGGAHSANMASHTSSTIQCIDAAIEAAAPRPRDSTGGARRHGGRRRRNNNNTTGDGVREHERMDRTAYATAASAPASDAPALNPQRSTAEAARKGEPARVSLFAMFAMLERATRFDEFASLQRLYATELVPFLAAVGEHIVTIDTQGSAAHMHRHLLYLLLHPHESERVGEEFYSDPTNSWPLHMLYLTCCFYATARRCGYDNLYAALRRSGGIMSLGKGIFAALAVAMSARAQDLPAMTARMYVAAFYVGLLMQRQQRRLEVGLREVSYRNFALLLVNIPIYTLRQLVEQVNCNRCTRLLCGQGTTSSTSPSAPISASGPGSWSDRHMNGPTHPDAADSTRNVYGNCHNNNTNDHSTRSSNASNNIHDHTAPSTIHSNNTTTSSHIDNRACDTCHSGDGTMSSPSCVCMSGAAAAAAAPNTASSCANLPMPSLTRPHSNIEVSRVISSRSAIVCGHPLDLVRLDIVLTRYADFNGVKIHKDYIPATAPENSGYYNRSKVFDLLSYWDKGGVVLRARDLHLRVYSPVDGEVWGGQTDEHEEEEDSSSSSSSSNRSCRCSSDDDADDNPTRHDIHHSTNTHCAATSYRDNKRDDAHNGNSTLEMDGRAAGMRCSGQGCRCAMSSRDSRHRSHDTPSWSGGGTATDSRLNNVQNNSHTENLAQAERRRCGGKHPHATNHAHHHSRCCHHVPHRPHTIAQTMSFAQKVAEAATCRNQDLTYSLQHIRHRDVLLDFSMHALSVGPLIAWTNKDITILSMPANRIEQSVLPPPRRSSQDSVVIGTLYKLSIVNDILREINRASVPTRSRPCSATSLSSASCVCSPVAHRRASAGLTCKQSTHTASASTNTSAHTAHSSSAAGAAMRAEPGEGAAPESAAAAAAADEEEMGGVDMHTTFEQLGLLRVDTAVRERRAGRHGMHEHSSADYPSNSNCHRDNDDDDDDDDDADAEHEEDGAVRTSPLSPLVVSVIATLPDEPAGATVEKRGKGGGSLALVSAKHRRKGGMRRDEARMRQQWMNCHINDHISTSNDDSTTNINKDISNGAASVEMMDTDRCKVTCSSLPGTDTRRGQARQLHTRSARRTQPYHGRHAHRTFYSEDYVLHRNPYMAGVIDVFQVSATVRYFEMQFSCVLREAAVIFVTRLKERTGINFPIYTLLICPTVFSLLEMWDGYDFVARWCSDPVE